MPFEVACRVLAHQKGRTALAIGGVFVAILLIFIELGFFLAVPQGGMLIYDHMRFDLLLVSKDYVFMAQSWQFPQRALAVALKVPGVAQATPVYLGDAKWQGAAGGPRIDISIIGFDPGSRAFAAAGIESRSAVLARADTILVDGSTRPIFGPLTVGRKITLDGRPMTIGGRYRLGTGFLGLGVALVDPENFFRIFPRRPSGQVNFGLVTLRPGADPDKVAAALRAVLPTDTQVLTRAGLTRQEVAYWTTKTGTGIIFGSGLVVAFIVGIMILYQTLATQVARQLPQFAMLKAIGYRNRALNAIVLAEAVLIMLLAFLPALGAAFALYIVIRRETLLPATLSPAELGAVFATGLAMAAASALFSLGRLRRAHPADIF
ncbi:MAG TPA: FtsX-like permease family protein [Stellaceae bacterium]|nr:FtsX-like permease family protein [Stellaceae bacterium]